MPRRFPLNQNPKVEESMSFLQTTNSHGQQQVLLDNARMEHQGQGQHAGHGQGGSSNEFSRPPTLSESEIYRRVFHVKKPPLPPPPPPSRREDLPLDVTNSKSLSSLLIAPSPPPPAPTQLAPASPGPVTLLAPSDLDAASLKAALPYIPPHADYTIIQGKYEAAYHKNAPLPKKRSSKPGKAKNNKTKKKPTTSDPTKTGQPSAASRKQSKVLAVAEWKFPTNDNNSEEGTKKTWDFLFSEIAKGRDAQFVPTATAAAAAAAAIVVSATNYSKNPGRPTGTDRRGIKRKQSSRTSVLDENGVPIWNSLATNVEFDPRYLQYDNSPYGSLDQLVRPSVIVADPCSEKDDAFSEAHLQSVPDPPFYLTKTSRVGVSYQARVCRHKEDYRDKRNGSYLPEYEALWDPVLANKAEKDGQDIDGFLLGSNMTLSEREMKMKLLHVCDYNVADAQEEYNRIRGFGWEEDTSWSDEEKEKLKGLLETLRLKDFNYIAKEMKRSRSDCLVYYYRWKRTSRVYAETKKTWKHWHRSESKNDYCTLCDDGGSLMVLCDRCDCAYHLSCLDPPLSVIPEGDWFCPKCISKKLSQEGGGYISLAPRSSPASILWTSPARRAALGRETNRDTKPPPPPPVAAPRDIFRSSMPGLARLQMARESASPAAVSRSGGSRLAGTGRVPALPLIYRSPGQESSTQASIADSPFVLSDEESSSVFSEPADV